MKKRFTKKIENFLCGHCGKEVIGNGYTNHCPRCLWSKHVDLNPGDRLSTCQGMMRPILVERSNAQKEYLIIHRCERCGYEKKNRIAKEDDFDQLADIQQKSGQMA